MQHYYVTSSSSNPTDLPDLPESQAFSEKHMAQDDCFVLTPPEPRQ